MVSVGNFFRNFTIEKYHVHSIKARIVQKIPNNCTSLNLSGLGDTIFKISKLQF